MPLRDLEELRFGGSGDTLFLARLACELHKSEENFGKIITSVTFVADENDQCNHHF